LSAREDILKTDYWMCWDIFSVRSAIFDVVNLLCDFFPFLEFEDSVARSISYVAASPDSELFVAQE